MRMKKFFKGLSLSTIAAISLSACSNAASTSTKPKQDSKVIKVVQIGTLSGNTASFGTWEDQSFKMAIDEVNKSGGIHGRKIEITKADDQGNPTVAVNLARKMSTGDVSAAFAATLSTSTLAVLNVFDQAKIPQLTGSQDPSITTKGSKYVFRFNASSKAYTKTAADYIVKGLGLKKIAVLSNSGAYGRGEHATFVDALKSLNVTPITEEEVSPDAKDFTAQLMSIKAKNPEVIYIGAENVQAGLIVKQAKALKIDAKIVGGSPLGSPTYFQTAGAENAEGTIFTTQFIADANAKTKAFNEKFMKQYNTEANFNNAKAYDGAMMLVEAMKKAYPHLDGESIRNALLTIHYSGLTGDYKFDGTGEGTQQAQMGIIKNGKDTVIK